MQTEEKKMQNKRYEMQNGVRIQTGINMRYLCFYSKVIFYILRNIPSVEEFQQRTNLKQYVQTKGLQIKLTDLRA